MSARLVVCVLSLVAAGAACRQDPQGSAVKDFEVATFTETSTTESTDVAEVTGVTGGTETLAPASTETSTAQSGPFAPQDEASAKGTGKGCGVIFRCYKDPFGYISWVYKAEAEPRCTDSEAIYCSTANIALPTGCTPDEVKTFTGKCI